MLGRSGESCRTFTHKCQVQLHTTSCSHPHRRRVVRCTTIVVHPGLSGVVREAVILEVDLGTTLLQDADNRVKRAQAVSVLGAARMRAGDRYNTVVALNVLAEVAWRCY